VEQSEGSKNKSETSGGRQLMCERVWPEKPDEICRRVEKIMVK
jgi:hypothetical protein